MSQREKHLKAEQDIGNYFYGMSEKKIIEQ